MRATRVMAVLGIVLSTTMAFAGNNPKMMFAEARKLYAQKQFAQAAELFERVYDLDPDPANLYNAARAFEQAEKLSEALNRYKRYVQLGKRARKAPDARERIKAIVAALDKMSWAAKLTLQVVPPEATVAIDDGAAGKVPAPGPMSVGSHKARFEAQGYVSEERTFEIVAGRELTIAVSLRPRLTMVSVTSDPAGSTVRMDEPGSPVLGTSPLIVNLGPGTHALLCERPGYDPAKASVKVTGQKNVDARLVHPRPKSAGFLRVGSTLAGLDVRVDGRNLGTTPLATSLTVSPGAHVVSFWAGTRKIQEETVNVPDGGDMEVRISDPALMERLTRKHGRYGSAGGVIALLGSLAVSGLGVALMVRGSIEEERMNNEDDDNSFGRAGVDNMKTYGYAAIGVGGVGLIASIVALATGDSAE